MPPAVNCSAIPISSRTGYLKVGGEAFCGLLVGSPASQWDPVAVFLTLHLMKSAEIR